MKITQLISLFLVAILSGCGGGSSSAPEITPKEKDPVVLPPPIENISVCQNVGCEDNNKIIIEQIYTDVINGKNIGLVSSLYAESFIEHNPDNAQGVVGRIAYFTELTTKNSTSIATVKHIVADGDYVAVHWHFSKTQDDEFSGTAKIDLFKVIENVIIEQWDANMKPNADTESGNSVFSDLYSYGNTQPNNDVAIEDINKEMVTSFYLDLFNNKNLGLIDELVDPNYIQHNFWVVNGSGALRDFVANRKAGKLSIFLTLAEDDIVWTFSGDGTNNLETVDLWRVDNNINKIVEHWDVF